MAAMAGATDYRYQLFVSCADSDRPWAEGYLLPALGLSPDRVITTGSFTPGASLMSEFERAIRDSRYTVMVLTASYLKGQWSQFSDELASFASVNAQQDRLIPLLKEAVDLPLHIDFRVRLDCTDQSNWDSAVSRLRAVLGQAEPALEAPACPYPGMAPFRLEDARFFYGRDAEIARMLRHLRLQPWLVVIGPSGSGKSSLVFGGLLPNLVPGPARSPLFERGYWLLRDMRPGSQPVETLTGLLGGSLARPDETVGRLLTSSDGARRLLLVIDQFEETFTLAARDAQKEFIAALKSLRGAGNCAVLVTMRADFYPELMTSDLWPVNAAERLEIAPLRGAALRRAIEQPARDREVYLETGLVDRLVADAADEPGILPLLQETMVLLWSGMHRRLITLDDYRQLGEEGRSGLAVAMANRADAALGGLPSEEERAIARRIFLRLVQFGEGRPDTRRQQPVDRLRATGDDPRVFERVLRQFVDQRLLTLSGEEGGPQRRIDIAHEALIKGWPILARWIAERRRAELTRRRIEEQTAEWLRLGRSGGWLDALELTEVEQWLASPDAAELGGGDADLMDLVNSSRERLAAEAKRQREFEAARTAVEVQRSGDAITRRFEAGGEQIDALLAAMGAARQLGRLFPAASSLDEYPTISPIAALYTILDGIREQNVFRSNKPEIRAAAISPDGNTIAIVEGDEYSIGRNTVQVVSMAGDALGSWDLPAGNFSRIAFTDSLHLVSVRPVPAERAPEKMRFRVQVWELDGRPVSDEKEVRELAMWPDLPYLGLLAGGSATICDQLGRVKFRIGTAIKNIALLDLSPDGSIAVTAGPGGGLEIRKSDADTKAEGFYHSVSGRLDVGAKGALAYVGFNAAGNRIVAVDRDGTGFILDLGGTRTKEPNYGLGLRTKITGSRSAPVVAGLDEKGEVAIWNFDTDRQVRFSAHGGRMVDLRFTPDGQRVVTTGVDGVAQFRDLEGKVLFELRGHAGRIKSLQATASGERAVTLDMESVVRVWDISGRKGRQFDAGQGGVLDVAATADGFLTAGADGTVRRWSLPGEEIARWAIPQPAAEMPPGASPAPAVLQMARLSSDGEQLATFSQAARALEVWRLAEGEARLQGRFDTWPIHAAFSPDGRYVVAPQAGGGTGLYDLSGGPPVRLAGFRGWTYSACFDRDGRRIVTVGADAVARVWDLAGNVLAQFESRHGQILDTDFSPDNRTLAIACADGTVVVCDPGGAVSAQCFGHSGRVLSVRFAPDGRRIASVATDGTARLWDLDGRQIASFPSHLRSLSKEASGGDFGSPGVAFSAGGNFLAVPGDDGIVRLHEIGGIESLLRRAEDWLKDYTAAHR